MGKYFLFVFIALFISSAFAQEAEIKKTKRVLTPEEREQLLKRRKLKREQLNYKQQLKPTQRNEDDADNLITNKKIRAETGSKSRFSVSTALEYRGGSIDKPFDYKRPNIKAATATSDYSALYATVSGKWNITKLDSLSAGVGLAAIAPFTTAKIPADAGKRYQASDPYINYQHINKFFGIQTVLTFGALLYTAEDVRLIGNLFEVGPTATLAYDFGGSPFTIGTWLNYTYRFFDKETSEVISVSKDEDDPDVEITTLAGRYQNDYSMGAYPFIEYTINDTFNLRTLWGLYVYDHPRIEGGTPAYNRNKVYQSVGLGISITRDIYLYPNVQFIPDNARADRTNVALSANINLF